MRYVIAILLSAAALYATPQLRLSTSTVGPLNIAVGQNGPNQTVTTSNIGDGTLTLTASANVPWINASITVGSVLIALNTSTLAQGIFTGMVTVTAAGAIDSPQTIAVTVQMGGGVPSSLTFYVTPGGSATSTFVASNLLTTSVTPPSSGLTLSIAAKGGGSFQTTGSYLVTTSAPAGTPAETSYTGTIKVSASNFTPDVKNVPVTINVTAMPIVKLVQPSLQFNAGQGAAAVEKWIQLENSGASALTVASATVSTTAASGAAWLTASLTPIDPVVDPNCTGAESGVNNNAGFAGCVFAKADPAGLAPGKYTATITIAGNAKNGPFTVPVEMDVAAVAPPYSYYQGVVDNALFQSGGPVAPGGLVAIRGEQFTTGAAVSAKTLPLGTSLGGATVYVNGVAAPIYYAGASHVVNQGGQITFQMPYNTPSGQATIRVDRNDNGTVETGNTISVPVASMAPTLLQFPFNGTEYAIATFLDFVTFPIPSTAGVPSRPAKAGVDTLVFYGLGFGQTVPPATEGIAATGQACSGSALMVFGGASIIESGHASAVPLFCGLTPQSVGLYQLNVTVPAGTPTGSAVPVFLTLGSTTSNTVAIAVQ
jgi:uncharacterized protein (TIGR03437 family)